MTATAARPADRPRPPSIAVVSPFLDKRHGTERCIAEQIERLARLYGYEVHLYSQRADDVTVDGAPAGDGRGGIVWHRIPKVPGPHLVNYLWWFAANHLYRGLDRWREGVRWELVYSPGINCLDADVVSVHIVFGEFHARVRNELRLSRSPLRAWPRLLHRRLYYRLIIALERVVYRRPGVALVGISRKTAGDLARLHGRDGDVQVVYHGIDLSRFNPTVRERLRAEARRALGLPEWAFALLLVGNDWKTKGLPVLLEAVAALREGALRVLVVGRDDRALVDGMIARLGLAGRVQFLPLRPDVEFYYAAADAYVGPSLEDAFALPPAEAMACGLPVIVSRAAGVSEIVRHGLDGLVLEHPRDPVELAGLIRRLVESAELRRRLGDNAARTAQQYTWERNAEAMHRIFHEVLTKKRRHLGAGGAEMPA